MKYQAKPVIVDAWKIVYIKPWFSIPAEPGDLEIVLEDGAVRRANAAMQARYVPAIDDYWVVQADGYEYLNPRDVFERKYSPCAPDPRQPPVFKRATCRGSYMLNSACDHCERCDWERSQR